MEKFYRKRNSNYICIDINSFVKKMLNCVSENYFFTLNTSYIKFTTLNYIFQVGVKIVKVQIMLKKLIL